MGTRAKSIIVGVAAVAVLALGGAAIAGATQGDDEGTLKGATAERAGAAALKATGGGTVNAVEADSERGAVYEVEVRKPDGTVVDVRLDRGLKVVAIDGDSEKVDDKNEE